MPTPVYRHLDSKPVFLGLGFPVEWLFVITPLILSFYIRQVLLGLLLSLGLYVFFRVATHGQPENHIYNTILFKLRNRGGGHFSSAERAAQPRFRLIPYPLPRRFAAVLAKASAAPSTTPDATSGRPSSP